MMNGSTRIAPFIWPAVLSLLLVGLFLAPLQNFDMWWHLDSGRWMLEHRQYLDHEVHSFSMPGAAWLNFEWPFQVTIASVEWLGGVWGLLLFKAVLWWLILFLLLHSARVEATPVAMLLAPLLVSWQVFPVLHLRPHLFEGVLLACAIWLFHRQRGARDPLWYGVLIVVWANCHASVVVGAAALVLHYVWGADFRPPPLPMLLRRLPVGLLLYALIFATPNGFGILNVLTGQTGAEYMHVYILEWVTPGNLPPLMFVALLATAAGAMLRHGVLTPAEALLMAAFLFLGNDSLRFQYELGLLLIRPLAVLTGLLLPRIASIGGAGGAYREWLYGLVVIALLVSLYGSTLSWGKQRLADYPVKERQFPHVAMALLQPVLAGEPEVRVWNDYSWGGYLEWHGGERLKIYADGRTPTVFTEEMMLADKLTRTHPQLFRSQLAHWKVDAIVLEPDPYLPIPPGDPDWTLVGFDSISFIYVRADLARRYGLPAIGFDPFRPWPVMDAGRAAQAVQSVRSLLAHDADNDLAWLRLGQLLGYGWLGSDANNRAEAMDAFQQAINLNPTSSYARLGLAQMRQMAGQSKQQIAQPLLDMLDLTGASGFIGLETQVATLLLENGYPQQASKVLLPDDWRRHQQLDRDFDVWLLRLKAHASLGDKEKAGFDQRMAELLAQDAGPGALTRLQAVTGKQN